MFIFQCFIFNYPNKSVYYVKQATFKKKNNNNNNYEKKELKKSAHSGTTTCHFSQSKEFLIYKIMSHQYLSSCLTTSTTNKKWNGLWTLLISGWWCLNSLIWSNMVLDLKRLSTIANVKIDFMKLFPWISGYHTTKRIMETPVLGAQ